MGATSRAAKSRAVSRIILCSSVSSNSMAARNLAALGGQLHQPGNLVRALAQPRLRAHGDADARVREEGHVEGVVAEGGVQRSGPGRCARAGATPCPARTGWGARPRAASRRRRSAGARPRRDPRRSRRARRPRGRRRPGRRSRGAPRSPRPARVRARHHLAVQPPLEAAAVDDVPGERSHAVARPAGEAPGHQLAHALLGEAALEVGVVDAPRDVRPVPASERACSRASRRNASQRGLHDSP